MPRHPIAPALALAALSITATAHADAMFSLEGTFTTPTFMLDIGINLSEPIFAPEPFELRTYSHSGSAPGTNHAGVTIPSGGFDPTLQLRDGGGRSPSPTTAPASAATSTHC